MAVNLLHLTTRRFNIRACEVTPLDRPAVQHRQVLGFWNVAQHLETWASGPAFVALSDSLFANSSGWPGLRRTASSVHKSVRATGPRDRVAAISCWRSFSMPAISCAFLLVVCT